MVCPVDLLVIVTLAPLITAPLGSVTVPRTEPVETPTWAKLGGEKANTTTITSTTKMNRVVLRRREFRLSNIVHLPFELSTRTLTDNGWNCAKTERRFQGSILAANSPA